MKFFRSRSAAKEPPVVERYNLSIDDDDEDLPTPPRMDWKKKAKKNKRSKSRDDPPPAIEPMPTAGSFQSKDSGEELDDERSRCSRYTAESEGRIPPVVWSSDDEDAERHLQVTSPKETKTYDDDDSIDSGAPQWREEGAPITPVSGLPLLGLDPTLSIEEEDKPKKKKKKKSSKKKKGKKSSKKKKKKHKKRTSDDSASTTKESEETGGEVVAVVPTPAAATSKSTATPATTKSLVSKSTTSTSKSMDTVGKMLKAAPTEPSSLSKLSEAEVLEFAKLEANSFKSIHRSTSVLESKVTQVSDEVPAVETALTEDEKVKETASTSTKPSIALSKPSVEASKSSKPSVSGSASTKPSVSASAATKPLNNRQQAKLEREVKKEAKKKAKQAAKEAEKEHQRLTQLAAQAAEKERLRVAQEEREKLVRETSRLREVKLEEEKAALEAEIQAMKEARAQETERAEKLMANISLDTDESPLHKKPRDLVESNRSVVKGRSLIDVDDDDEDEGVQEIKPYRPLKPLSPKDLAALERVKSHEDTLPLELDEYSIRVDDTNESALVQCLKFYYCGAAAKMVDFNSQHVEVVLDDKDNAFRALEKDDKVTAQRVMNDMKERGIPMSPGGPKYEVVLENEDSGVENILSVDELEEAPDLSSVGRTPSVVMDVSEMKLALEDVNSDDGNAKSRRSKRSNKSASPKRDIPLSVTSIEFAVPSPINSPATPNETIINKFTMKNKKAKKKSKSSKSKAEENTSCQDSTTDASKTTTESKTTTDAASKTTASTKTSTIAQAPKRLGIRRGWRSLKRQQLKKEEVTTSSSSEGSAPSTEAETQDPLPLQPKRSSWRFLKRKKNKV